MSKSVGLSMLGVAAITWSFASLDDSTQDKDIAQQVTDVLDQKVMSGETLDIGDKLYFNDSSYFISIKSITDEKATVGGLSKCFRFSVARNNSVRESFMEEKRCYDSISLFAVSSSSSTENSPAFAR